MKKRVVIPIAFILLVILAIKFIVPQVIMAKVGKSFAIGGGTVSYEKMSIRMIDVDVILHGVEYVDNDGQRIAYLDKLVINKYDFFHPTEPRLISIAGRGVRIPALGKETEAKLKKEFGSGFEIDSTLSIDVKIGWSKKRERLTLSKFVLKGDAVGELYLKGEFDGFTYEDGPLPFKFALRSLGVQYKTGTIISSLVEKFKSSTNEEYVQVLVGGIKELLTNPEMLGSKVYGLKQGIAHVAKKSLAPSDSPDMYIFSDTSSWIGELQESISGYLDAPRKVTLGIKPENPVGVLTLFEMLDAESALANGSHWGDYFVEEIGLSITTN